jgi:DNA-binding response OmpR family regulator
MKFLLVDNNESIQRWHKKELEEEGYEIIISSTGEEALKKLKTEKPDIIIMEFLLPDIDGAVLIRKIKSKRPGIPLLLSTAFMKSSNLRELKEEIMNYADVNKYQKKIAM